MEIKDYYKVLGVGKSASQDEIKRAFRKLAREVHPDINPGDPAAEERFKEINEAYEVLSDVEKRKKYDRFGAQWKQYESGGGQPDDFDWGQWANAQQSSGRTGSSTRTMTQEEFEEIFGNQQSAGFSDFFDTLFGGASGTSRSRYERQAYQPRARPGRDIEFPIQISLKEAFTGVTRTLQFEDGRTIEADVPPGVRTGSRVRLRGLAGPGSYGGDPGDLFLKVEVLPDDQILRERDDLKINLPVDQFTLLLGGDVKCPTIDKTVELTIPKGTPNGKVFRLSGLGMPRLGDPGKRGDLFVTVIAKLPEKLTEAEIKLVQQWRDMRSKSGT